MRDLHGPDSAIDRTLVAWMPGRASATGEDTAEFHLHGGAAVIAGLVDAVLACAGTRLATPGEFTRRAFDNGRLDMSQVEGLADLLSAETASQRQQALALAGGTLGRLAEAWRERCLQLLAEAEAGLDFAEDEADVATRLDLAAADALTTMADELDQMIADSARAARIRDGLTIVVTGPPNVGKSSIVNALSMRDVAIVTPVPGTTRDSIEVPIDLGGVAAVLIDTAGLRDTADPVEAEGIARARAKAAAADLVMHVTDNPDAPLPASALLVINKLDLHGRSAPAGHVAISALSGAGMPALRQWLVDWAAVLLRPGEPALLAHARHREAFAEAAARLREAASAPLPELRAEALRLATSAFARIAGRVDIDDVLDQIFSRFCIGK
ncbi:tRNA modification GTPase [Polymorphobacter multimanifer]|uniref:tRNA modification GTPase MnmE n=2 Tax=Polymorphobacter multimanifer TaxID=1070431 RepID=A0A841L2Z5_9SPHN|nr:tRNA modification GTPase [Polymorphobacter multimanifer]